MWNEITLGSAIYEEKKLRHLILDWAILGSIFCISLNQIKSLLPTRNLLDESWLLITFAAHWKFFIQFKSNFVWTIGHWTTTILPISNEHTSHKGNNGIKVQQDSYPFTMQEIQCTSLKYNIQSQNLNPIQLRRNLGGSSL